MNTDLPYELDPEELELLESLESGEWEPVPDVEEEKRKLVEAAKATRK